MNHLNLIIYFGVSILVAVSSPGKAAANGPCYFDRQLGYNVCPWAGPRYNPPHVAIPSIHHFSIGMVSEREQNKVFSESSAPVQEVLSSEIVKTTARETFLNANVDYPENSFDLTCPINTHKCQIDLTWLCCSNSPPEPINCEPGKYPTNVNGEIVCLPGTIECGARAYPCGKSNGQWICCGTGITHID